MCQRRMSQPTRRHGAVATRLAAARRSGGSRLAPTASGPRFHMAPVIGSTISRPMRPPTTTLPALHQPASRDPVSQISSCSYPGASKTCLVCGRLEGAVALLERKCRRSCAIGNQGASRIIYGYPGTRWVAPEGHLPVADFHDGGATAVTRLRNDSTPVDGKRARGDAGVAARGGISGRGL